MENMNYKYVYLISFIAVVIMTVLFPILMAPINLLCLIFSKGKIKKGYAFLLAFSLAVIAYVWIPDSSMDLYRHHLDAESLSNFNVSQLWTFIQGHLEPLHYCAKFLVAQTGDYNLLQFAVTLLGYSSLFWMLCDFSEVKKINNKTFTLLFVYVFSSLKFIGFISGLWCNYAIINLALGLYLKHFRKAKILHYLFYAIAVCLHVGTIYVVIIAMIIDRMKIFKKIKLSTLMIIFIVILSFGGLVLLLNNVLGRDNIMVSIVNKMYDGYFVSGGQYDYLHTGWNLYMSIVNIVFGLIIALKRIKNDDLTEYRSLVVYTLICLLASIINAGVFIRFNFLASVLLVPVICEYLAKRRNKTSLLLVISMILCLTTVQAVRSYMQIKNSGLLENVKDNAESSMFEIMGGK